MEKIKYILLLSIVLNANSIAIKAQDKYNQHHFKESLKLYLSIDKKSDKIYYNIATTLYRLKRYKEAINNYKLVKQKNMQGRVLYNIGNCYIALNIYKEAIVFYKSSLKYIDNNIVKDNLKKAQKIENIQKLNKFCKVSNPFKSNVERELKNFDNEDISKNLKDAKYKPTNIQNNISNQLSSSRFKVIKNSEYRKVYRYNKNSRAISQKYIEKEISSRLKNRELKSLLIPIKDKNDY